MTYPTTSPTIPPTFGYAGLPILIARMTGDEKHDPASNSTIDVLWVLYDRILRVSPATVDDPDRDRFLLSKGHGPMAYYAVLAAKGFIPPDWLDGFATFASPLGRHPDRLLIPGVEISSGSLGHGLPLGVGVALGLRAQGRTARIVVLVDALDEIRYGPRGEDVLSWLAACPALPPNARFVLTARPDSDLLSVFRRNSGWAAKKSSVIVFGVGNVASR